MGEAHVVDLTLTDARVEDGPGSTEIWTASVTLSGRCGTVSGNGIGKNLGKLTADFREDVGSQRIGRALRTLLLPRGVETALQEAFLEALRADALLQVRIHCTNPRFAGLPWELTRTWLPESTLDSVGSGRQAQLVSNPKQCVVSRVSEHVVGSGEREALRSLVATAANALVDSDADRPEPEEPADTLPDDDVDRALEAAELARVLLERVGRTSLLSAATRDQLTKQLETTAHVVCVIAHGWTARAPARDRECGIVLQGSGEPDYVPAAELAALLKQSGTQLVVLVSCDTAGLGDGFQGWGSTADHIVASGIPAVVAMQAPVEQGIGQEFLVGLVTGLTRHGEIHSAMSEGLRAITRMSDIVGHLGVPALYTARNGLRLRDAPSAPVSGPTHAYPIVASRRTTASRDERSGAEGTVGTDSRRVRLDVVWGLERRPFAGVLLDVPGHDLAQKLNGSEKMWDEPLKLAGLPARRWFTTDVERPPAQVASWEQDAAPTRGEWNDFRDKFDKFTPHPGLEAGMGGEPKDKADDGWVLRTHLPAWSPDWWRDRIGPWITRLRDRTGRLARPFIVVLQGPVSVLEDNGLSVLAQVREDLERRLGTPVTALSRHRPGQRYQDRNPEAVAHDSDHPATEQALLALRRQDPLRYAHELERLAADDRLPGRPASLTVAADYDDDIRAWIGALRADQQVPRPSDLPLGVDSERADAIALALLGQRSKVSDADLLAWDDPLLSPPVRRLVRQYRTAWAEPPDEDSLADWLSAHPDSAPAVARAGSSVRIGAVLSRLPPTTAPWPLLCAFGVEAWALHQLLQLPQLERHALGLVRLEPLPAGFDAAQRAEHIRKAVGRAPTTVQHSSANDKATG
ncbi:CHAT domain-containing protein [Streptomyces sp. NPDC002896]|uniref:CHAT domain-containing protein n=1 Tax=Streptomyces sp. NPDC002896 TaxID=3154438 RepID=UPI003322DDDD